MIDINKLYKLYETAFKVRYVESLIADNYHLGLMRCPTHLSIGQELVPSMMSIFHVDEDLAVSTHRSHGHYIGKKGSIIKFFDELHGLDVGCSCGNGGSMHLIDKSVGFVGSTAIVANTIPIGVGLANAQKLNKENNITYIFIGDGATEEGVFYESLHYSSVNRLPCFFIIENNEFSVYTDLESRQKGTTIKSRVEGFNVDYSICNNHDFYNLYDIWSNSLNSLRKGKGTQVIEVKTHRYREHCGPNFDDHLNYRDNKFLEKWKKNDYLDLLKVEILKIEESSNKIHEIEKNTKEEVNTIYESSVKKRQNFLKHI